MRLPIRGAGSSSHAMAYATALMLPLGIEALSRGVSLVEAVESNPESAKVCLQNFELISNLEGMGEFKLHTNSVFEFLNHNVSKKYEIIFLDPPYTLANSEIEKILKKIISLKILSHNGVIAIERNGKTQSFNWPPGLSEIKVRSYGAECIIVTGKQFSLRRSEEHT